MPTRRTSVLQPIKTRAGKTLARTSWWRNRQAKRAAAEAEKAGYGEYFDPHLKARFVAGEDVSLAEIERAYDRLWEGKVDDCVRGDDLDAILGAIGADCRTCLDVGCGAGRVAVAIAQTGRSVTATDISEEALKHARLAAEEAGVDMEFVHAPMERLPFPDRAFDTVVTTHTLEHVKDLEVAAAELCRVAGRQVVVLVPREDEVSVLGSDYHFQCFPDGESLLRAFRLPRATVREGTVVNPQWHGNFLLLIGDVTEQRRASV